MENVRLGAFANLHEAKLGRNPGPNDKPRFNGVFIVTPENPGLERLAGAIKHAAVERWGTRADLILQELKAGNRLCLHNGAEKASIPGYAGNLYINTGAQADKPPIIIGKAKQVIKRSDSVDQPYPGCYTNVQLEVWAQDNEADKGGKRINARLLVVQFYRDGDAFVTGAVPDVNSMPDVSVGQGAAAPAGRGALAGLI